MAGIYDPGSDSLARLRELGEQQRAEHGVPAGTPVVTATGHRGVVIELCAFNLRVACDTFGPDAATHVLIASGGDWRWEQAQDLTQDPHGDPAATPLEHAIERENQAELRAAVAELSDDQREVVELRLSGLTGPEIAASLGKSHAAVKMLQLRAVQKLRTLMSSSRSTNDER